jgi:hypothetical protein
MAEAAPLTLVRAPAWQALTRRLDTAVARDARLAAARDSILRPVEVLQVMAGDAQGALADDVLRADRLRTLLFVASPYAAVASEARVLLAAGTGAADNIPWPEPQAYEPGVIDHAALLGLMLAAARVADRPLAPVFVATVHGLALAASAVEVLGRLDPRQPDAAALETILETVFAVETARPGPRPQAHAELLRAFALDPVERGRWRCLDHLLASGPLARLATRMNEDWDGATSHEIVGIEPRTISAGDVLAVTVTVASGDADPLNDAHVIFASADGEPLIAEASLRPVPEPHFASAAGAPAPVGDPAPAPAELHPAGIAIGPGTGKLVLEVLVPDGAETGWIGFSRTDRIARSNERRDELRDELAAQLAAPGVEGLGRIDATRVIPHYGAIAVPRRRGLNRIESGRPAMTFATVTPANVLPGATFELAWETTSADAVSIASGGRVLVERGEPAGRLSLTAGADDGDLEYVITPRRGTTAGKPRTVALSVGAAVTIAAVELKQEGRASPLFAGRPLDVIARLDTPRAQLAGKLFLDDPGVAPIASEPRRPGAVAFTIPADAVHDRMAFTIVVTDATGARVTVRHGPLALGRVTQLSVVLVRPVVVDFQERRIELESALPVLKRAARPLGLDLDVNELPWLDDELAAFIELPATDADPALHRALEALAHRALVTPGFEDALWLALLPGDVPDPPTAARWVPGYAARALAVAGPVDVGGLLADVVARSAPARPAGRYLALHGTLTADSVQLTETRVDDRRAGPGAPSKTGLEVVSCDAAGRELARHNARVLSEQRPAQLDLLIPLSDEAATVELRCGSRTILALARVDGELTLDVAPVDPQTPPKQIEWSWTHDRDAPPAVSLVLQRGPIATPALALDPHLPVAEIPLWRFRDADGLALYATDGWNAAEHAVYSGAISRGLTAVVRRLGDGRYFAEVPFDADVAWYLDGEPCGENDHTLELNPGDAGELVLEARRGTVVVRDRRTVAPGEVM